MASDTTATDLLAGPAGITCTTCGAVLPSGAAPAQGHATDCTVAARWIAESVLGGTPATLAAGLAREAMAAGGVEAVRAVAVALRAVAARVVPGESTPRRVYLAGGAAERLTVCRPMIQRLVAAGVDVTHDWTSDPGWECAAPTRLALEEAARADLAAVRAADVLWYLAPARGSGKSEGAATELGAALAWGLRIVVSGAWGDNGRIFTGLAGWRYDTHEEGFAAVVAMVGAGARLLL